MKRTMRHHPKLKKFARRLGVEIAAAAGYLEFLWGFTADMCPSGDIGRFDDDDIAEAAMFPPQRPAGDLIATLVSCRLVDEHPTHRLIVHDWSEHADRSIHQRLARHGTKFADGYGPYERITRKRTEGEENDVERTKPGFEYSKRHFEHSTAHTEYSAALSHAGAQPEPEPEPEPEPAAARPPGPARACVREAAAALASALHAATPSEPKPPGQKLMRRITEAMGDMPPEELIDNLRDFARRRSPPKGYGFWPDVVSDWAKKSAAKPELCPKCRGDGRIYLPIPDDATTADIDAGKYITACDCKKLTQGTVA